MSLLEVAFPNLADGGYQITSPVDSLYNCVVWAAGDTSRWWWPDAVGEHFWPPLAPREETLDAFVTAFATLAYTRTDDPALAPRTEKLAVYARSGLPTHVARLLPSGKWTSKLGHSEDVEHTLDGLTGSVFGQVAIILQRAVGG